MCAQRRSHNMCEPNDNMDPGLVPIALNQVEDMLISVPLENKWCPILPY